MVLLIAQTSFNKQNKCLLVFAHGIDSLLICSSFRRRCCIMRCVQPSPVAAVKGLSTAEYDDDNEVCLYRATHSTSVKGKLF